MTWFLLYLFVMSGKVAGLLATFGKILVIPAVIYTVVTFVASAVVAGDGYEFDSVWGNPVVKKFRRICKYTIPAGALLIVLSSLIPSPKQLALIAGGGVTYEVLTSEPAKQIGGKALELLNKKIDEALKDETETSEPSTTPNKGETT